MAAQTTRLLDRHAGLNVRCVQHDDVVAGVTSTYDGPESVYVTYDVAEVREVIAAAQASAQRGSWVVGFVAYEAAAAFDPAMTTRPAEPSIPLACFVTFRRKTVTCRATLAQPGDGHLGATRSRRGGSGWYRAGVEAVRERIAEGTVYQVNLTDRVDLGEVSDPDQLYQQLISSQGSESNWLIDLDQIAIIAASPERFFDFNGTTIVTRPMKGTAGRRARHVDDDKAGQALQCSEKDRAENVMIVDLLRNDLSRLAKPFGVTVPRLLELERYETVWQLTSTIEAQVKPDVTVVDVFDALFPCGSVTGAPKIAAMSAIADLEPWPRGVYCGAIGVIEPPLTDSGAVHAKFDVAIRTAVVDRVLGTCTYGSGGGITWDSHADDEDAELEAKTAILSARRPPFELVETLLFNAEGAQHLQLHLARLAASAEYFGFVFNAQRLTDDLAALTPVALAGRLRVTLNRRGEHDIAVSPLDQRPVPVRLGVSPLRVRSDDPFMCHKTTNRVGYAMALASVPWADDAIMVNEHGHVVETTIANLLFNLGGQWSTPPLSDGGLDGVGRRVLLDRGAVSERSLHVDDLQQCSAIATISSLRGWRAAMLCAEKNS